MIKLLIVDDEPLVQIGIKSMVNWADLGIEVCGAASPFMAVPQISTPKSAQFIMDLMPICTKGSSSTISSLIICKIPLKVRLTGMEA